MHNKASPLEKAQGYIWLVCHEYVSHFLYLPAGWPGDGENRKENGMKQENWAKAEDVRICCICGKMIIGECDYTLTKRHTKIYFHKGRKCGKEKT